MGGVKDREWDGEVEDEKVVPWITSSSSQGSISEYLITSNNPQEDNFHNFILVLTKWSPLVALIQQS